MALLWIEGFEGYGTSTGVNPQPSGALGRRYSIAGEGYSYIETGRISGYCLRATSSNLSIFSPALTTNDTLIIGFAFKSSNWSTQQWMLMAMYDGGTLGMNIRSTLTGEIQIRRGTVVQTTTSGLALAPDTWYHAELKVKCDNTTGTYELKINGTSEASASGVDTQAGSNAYHDRIKFGGQIGIYVYWDDLYVCDGSGTDNNDFLGNCRVTALFPNGDDTANFATANPGGSHYANVDENPADDDTSYVEDTTTGNKDLYDYGDLSGTYTSIYGIQINTDCRETDATDYTLKTTIKSGGAEYDDTAQAMTSNYTTLVRVAETDPDTGNAWNESTINAAQFGVKVG